MPTTTIPHEGMIITPFREYQGTYERYKAEALSKHLMTIINMLSTAASVEICPQAPERPWVSLQEWVEGANGNRHGQWCSDLHIERLR